MESKYLTLARRAREEDNVEDARKFYDLVRTDDPDNVEARFFYAYYRLWDGTKGSAYSDFVTFCNSTMSIVEAVAKSDLSSDAKVSMLADMYGSIKGLPSSMSAIQKELWESASESEKPTYNKQMKLCQKYGIENLYHFGDAVQKYFSGDQAAQKVAVDAWKSAIANQQKYPYCGAEKTLPEKYLPLIQKVDPSYVLPKKAGCISFA